MFIQKAAESPLGWQCGSGLEEKTACKMVWWRLDYGGRETEQWVEFAATTEAEFVGLGNLYRPLVSQLEMPEWIFIFIKG